MGGGTPKTTKSEYWEEISTGYLSKILTMRIVMYILQKNNYRGGLNNSSTKLLQKNDIIISARGTVGELAMIPYPMAFNQSCYGIRAVKGVDSTFLYYLIKK